jgi:hypothetical protein
MEEDTMSGVFEIELRECVEEQGAGAREPADSGEPPLFLTPPDFIAPVGKNRR